MTVTYLMDDKFKFKIGDRIDAVIEGNMAKVRHEIDNFTADMFWLIKSEMDEIHDQLPMRWAEIEVKPAAVPSVLVEKRVRSERLADRLANTRLARFKRWATEWADWLVPAT